MKLITIDGPSASGKGTVSALVAQSLGWQILDSGALYRLSAYASVQQGIDTDDEKALAKMALALDIVFTASQVRLNGVDVSEALRDEKMGAIASTIAKHKALRQALLERQRHFYTDIGLVADGRDMGTVVFPHAPLKIFLIADVKKRAQRRYQQFVEKGKAVRLEVILHDLQQRDEQDMHRAVAPLKPATDAVIIDSSYMGIEEVVDRILQQWHIVSNRKC